MLKIEKNQVVSLRYRMTDDQGNIVVDQMNDPPQEYIHGVGHIHPALETPLQGLFEGACKKIVFTDPNLGGTFYFNVQITGVRSASENELIHGVPDRPAINEECGPDCSC